MCTATYFDFIFCTATFAMFYKYNCMYVWQLQLNSTHLYLLTYYRVVQKKTAHFQFTSDRTDATVTDNEWRHSEVILEWGPTWQAQSASL